MAITGLPLLATRNVGASSQFLEHGKNGVRFEPSDVKETLETYLKKDDSSRADESQRSHELGITHTGHLEPHLAYS